MQNSCLVIGCCRSHVRIFKSFIATVTIKTEAVTFENSICNTQNFANTVGMDGDQANSDIYSNSIIKVDSDVLKLGNTIDLCFIIERK